MVPFATLTLALLSLVANAIVLRSKQAPPPLNVATIQHSHIVVEPLQGDDADLDTLELTYDDPGVSTLRSVQEPVVQILGMKSCGTNLFLELIKRNLGVRVLDRLDLGYSLFWKHSPINQIVDGRPGNQEVFPRVTAVAVVRNPFSILKHYYFMANGKNMCGIPDGRLTTETLDLPCGLLEDARPWDGGKTYFVNAKNIVALWNDYVRNYLDTLPHMGFKNSTVIRFEDLVLRPDVVMGQVATLVGAKMPVVVSVPSQPMGPSNITRDAAIEEVGESLSAAGFSPSLVAKICAMLDLDLMRKLHYTECLRAL